MSRPTAGPWRVVRDESDVRFSIQSADDYFIAECNLYAEPDQTGAANARLLAAAPELLEAVYAARAAITNPAGQSVHARKATLDKIDAALAKAEAA